MLSVSMQANQQCMCWISLDLYWRARAHAPTPVYVSSWGTAVRRGAGPLLSVGRAEQAIVLLMLSAKPVDSGVSPTVCCSAVQLDIKASVAVQTPAASSQVRPPKGYAATTQPCRLVAAREFTDFRS
jgi:hypothetical protein